MAASLYRLNLNEIRLKRPFYKRYQLLF